MKIYFIRHAEPNYDLSKKDHGEFPGPSLSNNGLIQAEELNISLSNIKCDRIYCSDLERAKQTIEPFARNSGIKINYDSRIRETADVINNYLEYNDFIESEISQKERLQSFVKEIKSEYKSIIIISHFNTIEFLSRELGGNIKKPEYARVNYLEI